MSDMSNEREKVAENKQRKNQFARIRMLQTEVGGHLYVVYSPVMLTFRTDDSDNTDFGTTFGRALVSCSCDFCVFCGQF